MTSLTSYHVNIFFFIQLFLATQSIYAARLNIEKASLGSNPCGGIYHNGHDSVSTATEKPVDDSRPVPRAGVGFRISAANPILK